VLHIETSSALSRDYAAPVAKVEALPYDDRTVYSVAAFNRGVGSWLARLPTVWVEDNEVDRAKPIVDRYRETDRANADERVAQGRSKWKCSQCGELSETQFDRCWHCGHARPTGTALA
jgi:rubrerythrin